MPNRIKELRADAGLTVEQLADAVGCSNSDIEAAEVRPDRSPSARLLPGLADALGCSMADVLGIQPTISDEQADKVVAALGLGWIARPTPSADS